MNIGIIAMLLIATSVVTVNVASAARIPEYDMPEYGEVEYKFPEPSNLSTPGEVEIEIGEGLNISVIGDAEIPINSQIVCNYNQTECTATEPNETVNMNVSSKIYVIEKESPIQTFEGFKFIQIVKLSLKRPLRD